MLDLSNIFNKDIKKAILSKEQLAEMLKVTPEALEAFERSYQLHSMNDSTISDNLFKVNAKQAAGMNPKVHDYIIYSAHEETLMKRYQENKETVYKKVENLLPFLNLRGQWSMDIMQNGEDFYIIDMALAKDSALQSCVPKGMIKAVKEDWIPRISENYWPSERD